MLNIKNLSTKQKIAGLFMLSVASVGAGALLHNNNLHPVQLYQQFFAAAPDCKVQTAEQTEMAQRIDRVSAQRTGSPEDPVFNFGKGVEGVTITHFKCS